MLSAILLTNLLTPNQDPHPYPGQDNICNKNEIYYLCFYIALYCNITNRQAVGLSRFWNMKTTPQPHINKILMVVAQLQVTKYSNVSRVFLLQWKLSSCAKGFQPPALLETMVRKMVCCFRQNFILSSLLFNFEFCLQVQSPM